jgi:hypothetical protein
MVYNGIDVREFDLKGFESLNIWAWFSLSGLHRKISFDSGCKKKQLKY